MDEVETLLRHLALGDEASVQSALVGESDSEVAPALAPKVEWLVRLAALIALDATTPSLRTAAQHARQGGASDVEIAGVLMAVGSVVGISRVVSSAPRLASAMGFDLEADE